MQQSIRTFTGKQILPFDPRLDDIDIIDIAHGLSNICRYGGQSNKFYSVAEHSCYVSDSLPDEHKLRGLLHDAEEAYLGDMVAPIKDRPQMAFFCAIGTNLQRVINARFNVDNYLFLDQRDPVHAADIGIRDEEIAELFYDRKSRPSKEKERKYLPHAPLSPVVGFEPYIAKTMFLKRFHDLTEGRYRS